MTHFLIPNDTTAHVTNYFKNPPISSLTNTCRTPAAKPGTLNPSDMSHDFINDNSVNNSWTTRFLGWVKKKKCHLVHTRFPVGTLAWQQVEFAQWLNRQMPVLWSMAQPQNLQLVCSWTYAKGWSLNEELNFEPVRKWKDRPNRSNLNSVLVNNYHWPTALTYIMGGEDASNGETPPNQFSLPFQSASSRLPVLWWPSAHCERTTG